MSRPRVLILIAGMLVALAALAAPARAANEVATRISIRPMDPVTVGVYLRVTVDLTIASGAPLADEPVTLAMNDVPVHRTRTDLNGIATFRLGKGLAPGEYVLAATYEGKTDAYFGATARSTLVVVPFGLTVETVPPLPGMVFELDGTRFVAGDDGVARIAVAVGGVHELAVIEHAYRNPDQRAEFGRWNAEFFGPRISIRIPHDEPLQAGFDVFYRASQIFVDFDGSEVDPSRVTALTLHSSIGGVYTYPDGQARWFKASRTVRRPTGLESVEVVYSVQSVEVDGSNVVNSGQQRFLVTAGATWELELLLFSAHLTTRDALFGFPIGQLVDVTYPNGLVVRVEPDENGELWARWLARGNYRMTVAEAPGWAPVIPVALSRDQEVQLRVISYLDMAVAALAGLGLALGLLHIGRPHLLPATVADASLGYRRLVRLSRTLASRLAVSARTLASRLAVSARTLASRLAVSAPTLASRLAVSAPTLASRLAVSARTLASRLAVSARTLASRLAVSARTLASRLAVSARTLASRLAVSARTLAPVLISDPTRTGPGARFQSVVGAIRRLAMTTPGRRATPGPVRSVTAISIAATAIPTAVEAPVGAKRSRRGSSERAAPRALGAPATEPDGKVPPTQASGTEAGSPAARNAARRAVTMAVKPATHRVKGSPSETPTRVTSTATSAKRKAAAAAPKIAEKSTVALKAAKTGSTRATDAAPKLSPPGTVATAVAVKPNGKARASGTAANGKARASGRPAANGKARASGTAAVNGKARASGTAAVNGKAPASGRAAANRKAPASAMAAANGKARGPAMAAAKGTSRASGRTAAKGKTRASGRAAANGKTRASGRAAANGKTRASGRAAANGKTRASGRAAATTRRPRSHGLPAAISPEATALIALAIQVGLDHDGPEARQRQLDSLGINGPGDRLLEDWAVFPGGFAGGAPATAIESCRGCGLPHRVGARFCRRCGQVLAEPAPAGPSSNAALTEPSVHQPQRAAGGRKRRDVDGATAHRSSKRAERRRSTRGTAS